jgi:hypothetical protein
MRGEGLDGENLIVEIAWSVRLSAGQMDRAQGYRAGGAKDKEDS